MDKQGFTGIYFTRLDVHKVNMVSQFLEIVRKKKKRNDPSDSSFTLLQKLGVVLRLTLLVSYSLKFCMVGFKILKRTLAIQKLLVDLLLELLMQNP